ncbi:hypothetical protein G647_05188 [Cladophialophora carrionii CBS 160.54]|uniref:Zn(2)-C6 fungal-type domain-containing protein n=1 Tax=Cladophialophora carrionii CBS 160.54 TaxID=1279043 RepID=V9DBR2_9EURO|nr:uncharacterized protein G647_05188 [Cladophialophora carrionii CBS 160.54]ETI23387.1 hypothetical protein G647_05188 [Cladophialophora carrionii CBS 160.54]
MPPPRRPTRTKSKTGCKTCKIRRVRCGEERPACRRCVSTGRTCDGYGIWGGGGGSSSSSSSSSSANKSSSQPRWRPRQPQEPEDAAAAAAAAGSLERCTTSVYGRPRSSLPVHPARALNPDEQYHFEWFWRRTARKIPGAFFSDAGNALFFQACASDVAVTHGVLAMCSAHRDSDKAVCNGGGGKKGPLRLSRPPTLLRREEDFALRQYNKAIWHLRPHLQSGGDTTSLRIALYSCLAFIWVEYFRSRYQRAASHLEHGLRMLEYAHSLSSGSSRFGAQAIDHWVRGVFKKLYVQAVLFGQRPCRAWPFPSDLKPISGASIFLNAHEARDYLERILLQICDVMHSPEPVEADDARRLCVKGLMDDLNAWASAYDSTLALLESQMDKVEAFACRVLRMYHTMAVIMADTACECDDELQYDRHTAHFLSIIEQALEMRKVALNGKIREKYFGPEGGLPHSIGDMGLITPLYYVAVKCRVRRLRVHAIRLLEEEPRKEGIYDAVLVANIVRKVTALEGGLHRPDPSEDDFPLPELPREADLLFAQVPSAQCRVHILEVLLPDDPWECAVVRCRRQHAIERLQISAQLSTGEDDA